MKKIVCLLVGIVAIAIMSGCATGAHVDTPVVDVGAGAAVN